MMRVAGPTPLALAYDSMCSMRFRICSIWLFRSKRLCGNDRCVLATRNVFPDARCDSHSTKATRSPMAHSCTSLCPLISKSRKRTANATLSAFFPGRLKTRTSKPLAFMDIWNMDAYDSCSQYSCSATTLADGSSSFSTKSTVSRARCDHTASRSASRTSCFHTP
jgi:hypothetical protein